MKYEHNGQEYSPLLTDPDRMTLDRAKSGDAWFNPMTGKYVGPTSLRGRVSSNGETQILCRPTGRPTTKKPNPESLRRAIQDLPICAEGKSKVTKLVEEITGTKIEPERTYHLGQRFAFPGGTTQYMIASVTPQHVIMVNLESGNRYFESPAKVENTSAITEAEFRKIGDKDLTPIS